MEWQETAPVVDGYYWLQTKSLEHKRVVKIFQTGPELRVLELGQPGFRSLADYTGLWAGPLPEPVHAGPAEVQAPAHPRE